MGPWLSDRAHSPPPRRARPAPGNLGNARPGVARAEVSGVAPGPQAGTTVPGPAATLPASPAPRPARPRTRCAQGVCLLRAPGRGTRAHCVPGCPRPCPHCPHGARPTSAAPARAHTSSSLQPPGLPPCHPTARPATPLPAPGHPAPPGRGPSPPTTPGRAEASADQSPVGRLLLRVGCQEAGGGGVMSSGVKGRGPRLAWVGPSVLGSLARGPRCCPGVAVAQPHRSGEKACGRGRSQPCVQAAGLPSRKLGWRRAPAPCWGH